MASWPAAPPAVSQSPYPTARPMFDAAGIVVTDTSTPISAPDFAEVSDSTPASPATTATKRLSASGWEMKSVKGCVWTS